MLTLTEITGFKAKAPVEILDKYGRPFYVKEIGNNGNKGVFFNLPAGQYSIRTPITPLQRPIKYTCKVLPAYERRLPIPDIKVTVAPNPHKCSVFFKTGDIIIDPQMTKLPLPNLMHIFCHEMGHFFYKTEWKCDVFSINKMLKMGYNPSQCLKVLMHNLSSNKAETVNRAQKCFNYLKSVKWH